MQTKIKDGLHSAKESVKGNLQKSRESLQSARADVVAARKCENINDPIDNHVVDFLAMIWTRLFIALHIIPNVVTMLSMACGIAGGVLLALNRGLGMDILGCVVFLHSAIFDGSDGQVARLTKHFSRLGRMLDGMSDGVGYFTLYLACVIRLWNRSLVASTGLWHGLLIGFGLLTFLLYVTQCQLPDYFKNLHMYMIDNAHGNELSRSKHIREELRAAKKGSFDQFSQLCYYLYTRAQERRAPKTQAMLDAVELRGKSDAVCDAFYARSRKLVMLTNLLTFNLRTFVLLICVLLHWELIGMGFVLVVLEPIRLILLHKYEKLSSDLMPMI